MLTPIEIEIIKKIGDLYNSITSLPKESPSEFADLEYHVDAIARMIMARPTRREYPQLFNTI